MIAYNDRSEEEYIMKDEVMTANTEVLEEEIGCLENELLHSHRINPNQIGRAHV